MATCARLIAKLFKLKRIQVQEQIPKIIPFSQTFHANSTTTAPKLKQPMPPPIPLLYAKDCPKTQTIRSKHFMNQISRT